MRLPALLESLVQNHPFVDGKKRVASPDRCFSAHQWLQSLWFVPRKFTILRFVLTDDSLAFHLITALFPQATPPAT
jgi:hypothetical protein